ncbi:PepSY domain-containing protein [Kiloniella majae]|uniref:PepSY domain-containing protein n=1 Tax=Kiloniella majae TaxID=1938558 RepID=UPI000A278CB9|nr:PepSY domain-containing protein [Kiloniella majae]
MKNIKKICKVSLFLSGMLGTVFSHSVSADDLQETMLALAELNHEGQSLNLEQVISLAVSEQPGLVQKAEIEWRNKRVYYEVEIINGKNVYQLEIDPEEKVISSRHVELGETVFNYVTFGATVDSLDYQHRVTTKLQKGLANLEGQALDLELIEEHSRMFYEIKTFHEGRLILATLSARTGKMIFFKDYVRGYED